MTSPTTVASSRTVPAPADLVWQQVFHGQVEEIFCARYGPFPPVSGTSAGSPSWRAAGDTRTILLADGGSMLETLTEVSPPHHYRYRLEQLEGRINPYVSAVDGGWDFDPVPEGVRVTWRWTLHPRSHPLALTMIGMMWRGYARLALEQVERRASTPR